MYRINYAILESCCCEAKFNTRIIKLANDGYSVDQTRARSYSPEFWKGEKPRSLSHCLGRRAFNFPTKISSNTTKTPKEERIVLPRSVIVRVRDVLPIKSSQRECKALVSTIWLKLCTLVNLDVLFIMKIPARYSYHHSW